MGWGLEITTKPCSVPSGACDNTTPFYPADLSSDASMTWISPAIDLDGLCCGISNQVPPLRCV